MHTLSRASAHARRHFRTSSLNRAVIEAMEPRQLLTAIVVTSTADTTAAGTLRAAITQANTESGDTISFNLGSGAHTIQLASALPDLTSNMTITGPGASLLTIRRNTGGDYRILNIPAAHTITISQLTIANGHPFEADGEGGNLADGGGIFATGGTVSISNCAFTGNKAGGSGGAILQNGGGTLTVTACTFDSNGAGTGSDNFYQGGAICDFFGTLTVSNSTFSNNFAKLDNGETSHTGGGAISTNPLVKPTITNCTFFNNTANSEGGALDLQGGGTVQDCTLANNTLNDQIGDGNGGVDVYAGDTLTLNNSILAGSGGGNDIVAAVTVSGSHNLIKDANVPAGLTGTLSGDPKLAAALASNGGPTQTLALQAGSPAIDAGDNSKKPSTVTTDQRGTGFFRIAGTTIDIGAFEVQRSGATVKNNGVVVTKGSTIDLGSIRAGTTFTHTFTVTNSGNVTLTTSNLALDTSDFAITEGLSASIAPGASDTFTIQLSKTALPDGAGGSAQTVVSFSNNSPTPTFSFTLSYTLTGEQVFVSGNSHSITSGDTTPSTTDATDFGTVAQNAAAVSHTFDVENFGEDTLNVSSVTVPNGFTITQGLPSTIDGVTHVPLTIRLNTTTAGTFQGNVVITSDAVPSPKFTFAIKGVVTAAASSKIVLTGGSNVTITKGDTTPSTTDGTDFGTFLQGSSTAITHTFTVKNTGTGALTTSGMTVPNGFSIASALPATIAAGGSATFKVSLKTTDALGTYSGNVSFNNNAFGQSPFTFAIKGVVNWFELASNVLTINGTAGNDSIRGSITSNVLTMRLNNLSQTFSNASSITKIIVNAFAGNDLIVFGPSMNRPTSLNGGDGNDSIFGGSGADVINGGNGTDLATKGTGDSLSLVEEILA
jgi:hypothetical protein